MRMSPSEWANLHTKDVSLSKIWHSTMRPDVLRCWLTDCGLHVTFTKTPRTGITLEKLLAERARVEAAIAWVENEYYGGKVTEEHDYHSDGDEDEVDEEVESEDEESEDEESEQEGEEEGGEEGDEEGNE